MSTRLSNHPHFQHPHIQHDANIMSVGNALDLDHIVDMAGQVAFDLRLAQPTAVCLEPGDTKRYHLFIAGQRDEHFAEAFDGDLDIASRLVSDRNFIVRHSLDRIGIAPLPHTMRPTAHSLMPLSFSDVTAMHTVAVIMLFVHAIAYEGAAHG